MTKKIETTIENELVVLEEVKYPVSTDEIKSFLAEFKSVPTIDPEAENAGELYQLVLKGHKTAVKFRTSIEKKRKELKAPALEYGKKVDDIAKEYQAMVNPKELELFTQRKIVEDNEQRKQDELIAIERERVDTINRKVTTIKDLPLKWMNERSDAIKSIIESMATPTEEDFEEQLEFATMTYNTSLEQLTNLFNTKVQAENADRIQAEQEAKRKEEEAALEAERAKEREVFEAEKREFAKQQQEQQRIFQEQQEDINRQNAEREAEETERQQKIEAAERFNQEQVELHKRTEENKKLTFKHESEALDAIKSFLVFDADDDARKLLSAIIKDKIPHIKWEV